MLQSPHYYVNDQLIFLLTCSLTYISSLLCVLWSFYRLTLHIVPPAAAARAGPDILRELNFSSDETQTCNGQLH